MTDNATTVALVGLGNMGAAVASRLVRVGPLTGFDLNASRRDAASAMGVTAVDDLAAMADADVVVLSLPTPEISLTVGRTLAEHLRPGSIIVETSTVNPADMGRLADAVSSRGIRVVDAAILSGVGGMAAGTSVLLTGGRPEDLDAVAPVLEAMSGRIIRYSKLGTGMAAKVINNAVAHAVMVVLSEAASLAVATGITVEQIADLLRDPDAGLLRPLTHRIDERVRQGNYEGGMPTEAARKDSVLALQLAQAHDVPLFAIQGAHSVYELALAAGLARHDYASIATLWEGWTHSPLSDSARIHTTADQASVHTSRPKPTD